MKTKNKFKWDYEKRKELEMYLKSFSSVSKVAEYMGTTPQNIYYEIKKGITKEEFKEKMYPLYSADNSIKYQLEKLKDKLMNGEVSND
ncbi:MAG: hypothetical protein PUK21_03935 [Peptostreptococcaceae bacterium]|nr:hypothetical protein [Peptostreptococcaceae bacterium]MDY5739409.1 hypothetical protein [Anaerovoracaceae bacterium]